MPIAFAADNLKYLKMQNPNKRFYIHGSPKKINRPDVQNALVDLGANGFYLD